MKRTAFIIAFLVYFFPARAQEERNIVHSFLNIATDGGHEVLPGSSGFNARIGDKVWSYDHPDFIKAVDTLRPGWLRYWSGTAGDAFSAATGMYDKEYITMFDKGEAYDRLYAFVEVKGPHRVIDLYHLLGRVNGRLVITVNAFTETPEMTAELARFCRNNHIRVAAWQFCNEPYFYIPGRQRYWWNNGYDYALKMKPHADRILEVFPDAKLALNFTWDGIWGFMKEINEYQREKGAYWNVFSKHSYAPHTGKTESFEAAFQRANSKLPEVTGEEAMRAIEEWTAPGIPLLITEFGVWNRPLNGIVSALYNAEYTLRQLRHPSAFLIGSHEISNKARPAANLNARIMEAFQNKQDLNTLELRTGVDLDDEGRALKLVHEATSEANHIWNVEMGKVASVQGMNGTTHEGVFALAFKGIGACDYMVVTNRSSSSHEFALKLNGVPHYAKKTIYTMAGRTAEDKSVQIGPPAENDAENIIVPPYSISLIKWHHERSQAPVSGRIFRAEVREEGVWLKWWKQPGAASYIVQMKDEKGKIRNMETKHDSLLVKDLKNGHQYVFSVSGKNQAGQGPFSPTIRVHHQIPDAPVIFKTAARDDELTVFWKSVPDATHYLVKIIGENGFNRSWNANNVYGYKIKGLPLNVPMRVSVAAVNGKGESAFSSSWAFVCRENIPYPPSNVSAIETAEGNVQLEWGSPKNPVPGTKYKLYRGTAPHEFSLYRSGISDTAFLDTGAEKNKEYFYTVKSYNENGESAFYPNVATIIRSNKVIAVEVEAIREKENSVEVEARFGNIPVDGETEFGILLSDISYLNVEEKKFTTTVAEGGRFTVTIPASALRKGSEYAVKAFVRTNGGTPVISLPPHKNFLKEN